MQESLSCWYHMCKETYLNVQYYKKTGTDEVQAQAHPIRTDVTSASLNQKSEHTAMPAGPIWNYWHTNKDNKHAVRERPQFGEDQAQKEPLYGYYLWLFLCFPCQHCKCTCARQVNKTVVSCIENIYSLLPLDAVLVKRFQRLFQFSTFSCSSAKHYKQRRSSHFCCWPSEFAVVFCSVCAERLSVYAVWTEAHL